jgi:uncharacterized protein YegL
VIHFRSRSQRETSYTSAPDFQVFRLKRSGGKQTRAAIHAASWGTARRFWRLVVTYEGRYYRLFPMQNALRFNTPLLIVNKA